MEVSDVRRRLRAAIDEVKRESEQRRARNDEAVRTWERALEEVVVPAFHQLASALNAEGYRFKVVTPGTTARLVPERGGEEFVELALDTDGDEPVVMIRSTQGRGRRMVTRERPLSARSAADILTNNELAVTETIDELKHFLER
jgi:hypothetical protein